MTNLYIVATPIGNISDISKRAIETLENVNGFVTENRATTLKLLNLLNISRDNKKYITYADFNDKTAVDDVIEFIKSNKEVAMVSEAGTPLISDPGFKIVSYIRENMPEIEVQTVPGPSSITAHLSISGLPTDKFMFVGFLPKKKTKKENFIKSLKEVNDILKTTFAILESKYNLEKTLSSIKSIYPDCKVSVGSELTKMHEKVYFGDVNEVLKRIQENKLRGEYIIHLQI